MIEILLIDDEVLVCNYLRQLIDWEANGFRITGQAGTGHQAISKIESLKPDLIFLDVNMPVMNGVELIRYLNQNYPSIKVIMLSSYSDFHYVRETMKFGAVDYLLKHELTAENLLQLLRQLDFQGQEREADKESRTRYFLEDKQINAFLEENQNESPFQLHQVHNHLIIAARLIFPVTPDEPAGIEENSVRRNHLIRQILKACADVCDQNGEALIIYPGESWLVFLFSAITGEDFTEQENRASQSMGIIQDILLKYYNTCIDWIRGERIPNPKALPGAYKALGEQQFTKPPSKSERYHITIDQEQRLIAAVTSQDQEQVRRILAEIVSLRKGRAPLQREFSFLAGELLSLTVKLYQKQGIIFPDTDPTEFLGADMTRAYRYFSGLLIGLIEQSGGLSRFSWMVNAVIDYVQQHFGQDIGITDIARHCGMNSSYLSTVFKKETGIGLSNYVGRVRVHMAGTLMLTKNIPPTKVYAQVGFRNYNNYFKLFKEITGFSPKEFRRKVSSDWITAFHLLPLENSRKML
jgi:two-component system response regulator YesN